MIRARLCRGLSQFGLGWQHQVLALAGGVAISAAVLVAFPGPAASASGAGAVIYVANNGDNSVTAYNTSTGTATTVPVGDAPYRLAITPDGASVYVANSGSNTVSVISAATDTVTATVAVGDVPVGVAITPDGSAVYVTNQVDGTISVISTATNAVTATISIGTRISGIAIAPDGATAYVTAGSSLFVISTATNTVTATIGVGQDPVAVATSPNGSRVYVANLGSNTVSVIDAATGRGIATVGVGNAPFDIAITPSGSAAYVVNVSGTVSVIDTATNSVTATIEAGTGADGVAITADGSTAYVADSNENSLSVISTASGTATGTITGFDAPLGVAALTTTAAPVVSRISPAAGLVSGGTTVTITGSGLAGATVVDFGAVPAESFTVTSDTSITATTPPASAGQVDVTVTTAAGTSADSGADQYSYQYPFGGFLPPVAEPPATNLVTAGQAIPVTFSLGSNQGLSILAAGYPTVQQVNCSDNTPVTTATEIGTAGGSGLQYDPGTDTYTYTWKTPKAFKSTCQVLTIGLNDATQHTADFDFNH